MKRIEQYKWYLNDTGYALSRSNEKRTRLHHLILPPKKGFEIDHEDTNPLNNCKSNLRYATSSQNSMNKIVKGIWWRKDTNKWVAEIRLYHKKISLGCFKDKQDAISTRRQAELKYFGEFAYQGAK